MQCPTIPQSDYKAFSERIRHKTLAKRIPVNGSLEITHRCNLKCVHCYCCGADSEKELSTAQVFRLLDELAEAGCLWLLITGGEPLVRTDFKEIYLYAKRKGMIVTVFTNGTLLSQEIIDFFLEYPPYMIEVTLYGATQKTYETITGVRGSFEQCIRGIDKLLKNNLPLALKTILMRCNVHELEMLKVFAQEKNCQFRFDADLNPRLDCSKEPLRYRLRPQEVIDFDRCDEKRLKEWQRLCEQLIAKPESDYLYVCSAGMSLFHIDPYGEVSMCMSARKPSFNIKNKSFQKIWETDILAASKQKASSDNRCLECELISLCGHCPGIAYLETGSFEKPVDYLCELAHLRFKEFGAKSVEAGVISP
jgi:radical SAM protein with 4Fe4S-binding SPASM domain